eukprot:6386710-Ditylum_brightwellii.AAC.1
MKLEKLLSRWCKTGDELDQMWPVYFDHDDYALYPENTDWSPTSRCVPVKATTQDGTVTWECSRCSGQALGVNFCQDGTFQTYLDTLPEWESSLLEK